MNKLTIIRGIPGSGKSTLAKALVTSTGAAWFEADHYFYENGVYNFDINRLRQAHEWCQDSVRRAMWVEGKDVIVSNTFTTVKELRPYFEISLLATGLYPSVITMQNDFGSIHGVPDATMEAMKKRFTFDLSPLYS